MATTSPMAYESIERRLRHNDALSAIRASWNRSGAMNSTRKSSGFNVMEICPRASRATTTPQAIWMSGSDTRGISWSSTAEANTTANKTNANSSAAMRSFRLPDFVSITPSYHRLLRPLLLRKPSTW